MAVFVRSKRVTDPLNDKVKACLCGRSEQFSSSGSEHDGDHQEDYDSPSLYNLLIHGGFLQQEEDDSNPNHSCCSEASENSCLEDQQYQFSESEATIKSLLMNSPCRNSVLSSHLAIAMEKFAFLRGNKSAYMRNIMCFLRELGHNAGICKTTWDSTGALTAGKYEFIDVVTSNRSDSAERYILEIDFSGEFIIARPTKEFECLLKTLPGVYLGRAEDLKKIVRVMSDAAKKSLKSKDLLLPPWRKNRYMQLKWFGSYKRTTNLVPTSTVSFQATATESGFPAKCRSVVGFDATVGNSNVGFNFIRNVRFAFPAATRTR